MSSLLNFSDIFICEMQYCRLMCCCFTPGAKHAWSTSSACQHSEDKGVGQVMCCWMNDSWRVLHRHIALYSFSVWASDSRCQQITKNMGHVTSQQERWCLVPHSGNMVRYGILENVDFFFFFLKRMNIRIINWTRTKKNSVNTMQFQVLP